MYIVRIDGIGSSSVTADSAERAAEVFIRSRPTLEPGDYRVVVRGDDAELMPETVLPVSIRRTIAVGADDAPVLTMLLAEIEHSRNAHPRPMASAHEAWGVLAEEFAELQAEIMAKEADQDLDAMASEAIDIACACVRFVLEVCQRSRADAAPVYVDPPKEAQEAARAALAAREAAPKSKRGGLDTKEAGEQGIGYMHQGLIDGGCVTAVVLDRDVVGHLCLAEIKRRTPSVELHGRTLVPSRAVVHAPVAVGFRPLREGEAAIELARIKPGDRVRGTSRAGVHECIATRVQLDHPLYGHVVWGHWDGPGSDETYIKAGEVEVLEPGAGPLTADYGSGYRQAVLDSFAGADLEQLATWSGLAERHGWTDFPASRDAAVASGGREFPWLDPWNERGPRGPEVQP